MLGFGVSKELLSLRIDLGKEDKCNNACKQHTSKTSCSLILEFHKSCTRTRALDKSSVHLGIQPRYNELCDVGKETTVHLAVPQHF
jgi:hypothetical protein